MARPVSAPLSLLRMVRWPKRTSRPCSSMTGGILQHKVYACSVRTLVPRRVEARARDSDAEDAAARRKTAGRRPKPDPSRSVTFAAASSSGSRQLAPRRRVSRVARASRSPRHRVAVSPCRPLLSEQSQGTAEAQKVGRVEAEERAGAGEGDAVVFAVGRHQHGLAQFRGARRRAPSSAARPSRRGLRAAGRAAAHVLVHDRGEIRVAVARHQRREGRGARERIAEARYWRARSTSARFGAAIR